jgi:pyruvate kinase
MYNRTKIICTIGPASQEMPVLRKMLAAGMDCVRLNFSHGKYSEFTSIIKNIRALSKESDVEIAIIQDLQGPKIRTGEMPKDGLKITKGQNITLSTLIDEYAGSDIPVQYKKIGNDVGAGDMILIDDGIIELKVTSLNAAKTKLVCHVQVGGNIKSHKGINVPTASISAYPITEKDKEDLAFGAKAGVDYVALSFVKDASNILDLRKMLKRHGSSAKIIAKIERHEAIKNMEAIIKASDAVMVARGDLGVEVPAEQVPIHQRKIIYLSNIHGKPVIVATQMLDSMVSNPRATRAEISDAATAIFNHADAFMLSNETAVGSYPVEATHTLSKVATAVERDMKTYQHLLNLPRPEEISITNATCLNASKLAADIKAKYIVAITHSGYTAREIAKYRPFIPMIVFTPDVKVARQMPLVWGVLRSFVQYIHLKNPLPQIKKTLIQAGLVKEGDEIVICNAGFGKREKLITTTMI